jgi:hypothetical protein
LRRFTGVLSQARPPVRSGVPGANLAPLPQTSNIAATTRLTVCPQTARQTIKRSSSLEPHAACGPAGTRGDPAPLTGVPSSRSRWWARADPAGATTSFSEPCHRLIGFQKRADVEKPGGVAQPATMPRPNTSGRRSSGDEPGGSEKWGRTGWTGQASHLSGATMNTWGP